MKKTRMKLGYDVLMLIALALLFGGRAAGMSFHEIAGLALLAAFLVHLFLNRKWAAGAARGFLRKGTAGRLRLLFVLDALLLVSFAAVGVSGVMISRVLFNLNGGAAWRTVHAFSAALALILTGIHLGLHARFVVGALGGIWEKRGVRLAAAVCVLAVCVYGGYSLAVTDFTSWLAMPFTSQAAMPGESGTPDGVSSASPQGGGMDGGPGGGEGASAPGAAGDSLSVTPLAGGSGGAPGGGNGGPGGGNGGPGGGNAWPGDPGENAQQAPQGDGTGGAARETGVLPALEAVAHFFAIACVFATAAGLIDYALLRRKQSNDMPDLQGS